VAEPFHARAERGGDALAEAAALELRINGLALGRGDAEEALEARQLSVVPLRERPLFEQGRKLLAVEAAVKLLGRVAVEAHALEEVREHLRLGRRGVEAAGGDLLAEEAAVRALLRARDDVGGLLLPEAREELEVRGVGLERVGEGAVARGALLDVDAAGWVDCGWERVSGGSRF
jgi:hypothetical protein